MERMAFEKSVEKFYQYSKERLDGLIAEIRESHANEQSAARSNRETNDILNSTNKAEREAASNLLELSQGSH